MLKVLFCVFTLFLNFYFIFPLGCYSQDSLWEDIKAKARALSNLPFREPRNHLPSWLEKLSYTQWEEIHFNSNESLWKGENLPFEIQFYHLGSLYKIPLSIFEVDRGQEKKVEFSERSFFYGPTVPKKPIDKDIDFAGFSIYFSDRLRNTYCLIAKFLGACFFQGLCCGQVPGITARTLSINTAMAEGEEFPFFREFWILKPKKEDSQIELYAIVDSPSVVQACLFQILTTADSTLCKVSTQLFFRSSPRKIALAPLSAMFEHGENGPRWPSDFRNQVHEADGLLFQSSPSDWTWSPLENPSRLIIREISAEKVLGFGLVQRHRLYDHYLDLRRHFQDMPSAWVQLEVGSIEEGKIELLEIPLKDDLNKNILLYWTPKKTPYAGQTLAFNYMISWLKGDLPAEGRLGKVVSERMDRLKGGSPDSTFLLSFKGEEIEEKAKDIIPVVHVLSGGELLYTQSGWNAQEKIAMMEIAVRENGKEPLRLEGWLESKGKKVTERWYQEF
uniref:Glucans biosynthesis protein n=1 Tax=Candidatus Methylacidiphilum infernorum TaxID=511746 RepID=A0A1W5LCS6_9BACT|nr:glucans biosynthesis protein [Candidatus Methylacidiphilum infernorum]